MTEPLAVSIRDAAKRLGAGRDATYALVRSKRLRTIRVGGRQLVPIVELDRFIERELDEQSGDLDGQEESQAGEP